MGYESYSEFALKENMVASPEVVLYFLHDMSQLVRPTLIRYDILNVFHSYLWLYDFLFLRIVDIRIALAGVSNNLGF